LLPFSRLGRRGWGMRANDKVTVLAGYVYTVALTSYGVYTVACKGEAMH
jgi:hypothetical protein